MKLKLPSAARSKISVIEISDEPQIEVQDVVEVVKYRHDGKQLSRIYYNKNNVRLKETHQHPGHEEYYNILRSDNGEIYYISLGQGNDVLINW